MINFESFITRLDEESLQEIIGKEAISILNTMDSNLSRLYNLQTVIVNLFSPYELIQKKKIRDILINILKKEEAENLATLFTNVSINNPFEFLIKYRYKDENDFQKLFSFFQLPTREIIAKKEFIDEFSVIPQYPLFNYQRNAINEINNYLFHKDKRVLLHMPTGSGKTRTAMNIICSLLIKKEPGTILWFANTEELCEQAVSEFEKAWSSLGNREIKIYRYWGSSDLDITKLKDGFIVAGLAKTYNLLEKNSSAIGKVAGNCSLVIMDEAHMAIAKTYKLILDTFTVFNASLLGLSATPGRTWNNPIADEIGRAHV